LEPNRHGRFLRCLWSCGNVNVGKATFIVPVSVQFDAVHHRVATE
jgi:hypothetical protein